MRVAALIAASILALAPVLEARAADDPAPRFRGRPLAAALDELSHRGLKLIYTSAVVDPGLIVAEEPQGRDPRSVLDQLLSGFGLKAESAAGDAILIVRAPPAEEIQRDPRAVETIVVTPGRHEIVPDDLTGTRSLDGDELGVAPTPGGDPARVVTLLPGIAAADGSASFHARGSATRDISLILDGLELYDPFHMSGLGSPYSFIDGRMVEAIDLVGGGFTAERGDRHGGFLEMSSAAAPVEPGGEVEAGTLYARVGYEGNGPLGPILLSGRYWYPEAAGDTVPFGADGLRPQFGDLYIKSRVYESARTEIAGHALIASDRAKLDEPDGNERISATNLSGYLWLRAFHSWSDRVTTDTVVAGGEIERERSGTADPDDVAISVADDRTAHFFEVRNDAVWAIGGSRVLKGGIDVKLLSADFEYAGGPIASPRSIELSRSGATLGAYAAYRTALGSRIAAEMGVRWDRQTYTGDRQWSPRLNLAWAASSRTELRVGAGRFAQPLRIHELRVEDGETDYGPPELSRQLDFTVIHRFARGLDIRLDAYEHRLEQLQPRWENLRHPVELFPEVETDRVLVAPESARLRGVELSAQGEPGAKLTWWGSYTWSKATDTIDGSEVPRSWDQTHAGAFLVGYRFASGWFVSGSGTIHTGWPTTPESGLRNSMRLPAYARLDAKVGTSIRAGRGSVRLELAVMNLTDRDNACCVDEFTPDGGVTYDTWPGLTPSLQVVWRY